MYKVYVLELADGSYYVGFTNDLERRLKEHALGIACAHTKKIPFKKLLWSETQPDRIKAREREKEIKGWRREKKEQLWSGSSSLPRRASTERSEVRSEEGSRRPDHSSPRTAGLLTVRQP